MSHLKKKLALSYLGLRRTVGIICMALPFALMIGGTIFCGHFSTEHSISFYYHTCMRDLFVGSMCAVGLFMCFYYDNTWKDQAMGICAGVGAFGVAVFPTTFDHDNPVWQGTAHNISAGVFFGSLIILSALLFPHKRKEGDSSQFKKDYRRLRNIIYWICAGIMTVSVLCLLIYEADDNHDVHIMFWCETIALFFFGISWIVKGDFLIGDVYEDHEAHIPHIAEG